ncbi:unnamed protein product [Menidia menidia]|uniref:(Atlantic silverside) hypothetical protein n=1 Tax=Menidia menidia TaxID=238744 RepID=A0A8S4B5A6_9TELE|nr:unnamed protein product [Menidia menidia]
MLIARGSQCCRMRHKENARAPSLSAGALGFIVSFHNLEYDSSEEKNPRLIFYDEKDEVVKTVPVKEMKADEISSLLDSLGFYKRSQKGEEVPEEFQQFPLHAPRDEL